jgi:quercetin dioxygenase-like cupin family protein
MSIFTKGSSATICAVLVSLLAAGSAPVERLKNDKVVSLEFTLKPGEVVSVRDHPAVTVYFDDGSVEFAARDGQADKVTIKRGQVVFHRAQPGVMKNTGSEKLTFVRTEFLTDGAKENWGTAGLAPSYKLLIENQYARVYDIEIPAGFREPQHTHKARVVVCLSGAELKHLMPDGREEPSTLRTGEVAWRPAATHIGQNLGNTDLWVVAIEPK